MLNGGGWLWNENFIVPLHCDGEFVNFGILCVPFFYNFQLITNLIYYGKEID